LRAAEQKRLKLPFSHAGILSGRRTQRAFILLKVEPGHEREVMRELAGHDEVREVHVIGGEWDVLAVLEVRREIIAPSDEQVYNYVVDRLRKVRHVQDTKTLIPHLSTFK